MILAGQKDEAIEMISKVIKADSKSDMLRIIREYVIIEVVKGNGKGLI